MAKLHTFKKGKKETLTTIDREYQVEVDQTALVETIGGSVFNVALMVYHYDDGVNQYHRYFVVIRSWLSDGKKLILLGGDCVYMRLDYSTAKSLYIEKISYLVK